MLRQCLGCSQIEFLQSPGDFPECYFTGFENGVYLLVCHVQAVEKSLKSVNLFDKGVGDKQCRMYSGGMKRRLSVAISLIGNPKVSTYSASFKIQTWIVCVFTAYTELYYIRCLK